MCILECVSAATRQILILSVHAEMSPPAMGNWEFVRKWKDDTNWKQGRDRIVEFTRHHSWLLNTRPPALQMEGRGKQNKFFKVLSFVAISDSEIRYDQERALKVFGWRSKYISTRVSNRGLGEDGDRSCYSLRGIKYPLPALPPLLIKARLPATDQRFYSNLNQPWDYSILTHAM